MRFQKRKIAASKKVWLSTIKEESVTLNYEEKKETISKTIENWQFRRLTFLGKIVVIKSLLASQLVYSIVSPPYVEWTSERHKQSLVPISMRWQTGQNRLNE